MPILGIEQPALLPIDSELRLRRFDGACDFALAWYQDDETLLLVDGKNDPYDLPRLQSMYRYLDAHGELYWIELCSGDGVFRPVGDVTFWQENLPIVIGERGLRGQGVGSRVLRALVSRARTLGFSALHVDEIYAFNHASRALFEKAGFRPYEQTERGARYKLELGRGDVGDGRDVGRPLL